MSGVEYAVFNRSTDGKDEHRAKIIRDLESQVESLSRQRGHEDELRQLEDRIRSLKVDRQEYRYAPAVGSLSGNSSDSVTSEKSGRTVVGYAAVFYSPSRDLGGFTETIKPGAFKRSLADRARVNAYFNHDHNLVLGSTSSGTLRLGETPKGLRYKLDLPNTTLGRDVAVLIDRGDVIHNSFGFRSAKGWWSANGTERHIEDLEIFDVSIVPDPAYLSAKIVSIGSTPTQRSMPPRRWTPEAVRHKINALNIAFNESRIRHERELGRIMGWNK